MEPKDSAKAMAGESFAYDAFASYATDPDGELVRAVEGLLEGFHRRPDVPKNLIQELELCVDGRDFKFPQSRPETEPSSAIEQVIRGYQRQCRALIVFCGPAAKDHPWIGREIEWWGRERPDGPIYFAYTHGRYPDPTEHMPASLIDRGGPSNPAYFDLRGYYRNRGAIPLILSPFLRSAAIAATIEAGFKAFMHRFFRWPMDTRTQKYPLRRLGDVGDWRAVRSLDGEVCRIAAQLVSDKTGKAHAATDLTDAYLDAEHKARLRRLRQAITISVIGVLALAAAWIVWERLERQRRIVALADETQTQIDDQQFEQAMRLALQGLPAKDDMLWAPGWSDRNVQVLQAKLAGAANLSAFKALIRKDDVPTPECERLTSATYSRDGRWILTASECGVASVWDVKSMKSIASCRQSDIIPPIDRKKNGQHKPSLDWIRDSQFSRDGKYVVSVGPNGIAWIWSPSDADCKHSIILSGHVDDVRTGSFSADGQLVVTTSDDDTVRVWNAVTGKLKTQLALPGMSEPPEDYTTSAEFSPDNKSLVVTRSDGLVAIADTQTFKIVVRLSDTGPFVWRARFSSDGKQLATALDDGSVFIWDIARRTKRSLPKQFMPIVDASFSPDGRLIVTASEDYTIRVWDVATLEQRFVFRGHTQGVTRVEFSPDGKDILSSSYDGTARIWDAVTNVDQFTAKAHARSVRSSALSQDGSYVVTSSKDRKVILWRLGSNYELSQLREFGTGREYVTSASFDPEGRRIALAYSTGRASIVGVLGDDERDLASIRKAGSLSVVFSPDGNEVVIGSDEGNKNNGVWNISTGGYKQLEAARRIRSVDIDPGGTRVAMGSDAGGAGIWDTRTGAKLLNLDHTGSVLSVHFSSDGAYIVTASNDRTARIWDSSTGSLLEKLIHGRDVNDARFSRDGTRVVTASGDHTVRIWDVKTGTQMVRFEMAGTVRHAMFTVDGSHVVATSDDGYIKVFDVSWTMGRSGLAKRVCDEKLRGIEKFPPTVGQVSAVLQETNNLDPCRRSVVEPLQ